MKRIASHSTKCIVIFGLGLLVPAAAAFAQETPLYTFTGGSDGGNPPCGLISGGKGVPSAKARFYGTTQDGGSAGYGTVYEIGNSGSESVLHSFTGGSDGANPLACVITDKSGNLYGTTETGGAYGFGVAFKLTSGGTETVLYSFTDGTDGAYPIAGLVLDSKGNVYGTTADGGTSGLGVVFEIPAGGGSETVLHSFGGSDGAHPYAGLALDTSGNLYGTTYQGGSSTNCTDGCGTVFTVTPGGTEKVLHSFESGSDGAAPLAGVIISGSNVYGTTFLGGTGGAGTVFRISRGAKEAVLYSFAGGSDGAYPSAGVIRKSGYLYGTTYSGGANGFGTVFKTPDKPGTDSVLYSFTGGSDGGLPLGGVLYEGGNLFGTTYAGGDPGCSADEGCGVVFELTP